MNKELKKEITRLTLTLKPEVFRRDQHLLTNDVYELNRIDAMLRILDNIEAENHRLRKSIENISMLKKQAE